MCEFLSFIASLVLKEQVTNGVIRGNIQLTRGNTVTTLLKLYPVSHNLIYKSSCISEDTVTMVTVFYFTVTMVTLRTLI